MALAETMSRANADATVRAIVLTGAGDKAFRAGADLQTANPSSSTIPSRRKVSRISFGCLVHEMVNWFDRYVKGAGPRK